MCNASPPLTYDTAKDFLPVHSNPLVGTNRMCDHSTVVCVKAEFARLVQENASAPPGERLTEADMLIDPGYEEMLERQGEELCEEVGTPPATSCRII